MRIEFDPNDVKPKRAEPASTVAPSLGSTLKALRKAANMTQEAAANVMGVERTSVTNMEAGRQKVCIDKFAALADSIGLVLVVSIQPKSDALDNGLTVGGIQAGGSDHGND